MSSRRRTLPHSVSNCRSVPTARRNPPSDASNARYGSIVAWELPWRAASRPVTRDELATLMSAARPVETRFVFTCAPAPSRPRAWSAPRIAVTADQPASTSTSATPILYGEPSAGPVIAMSPVAPWARRSKPGSPASGPTSPAPEIEQTTRRGFRARSDSTPSPRLSSAPGRKFSTRTSAFAAQRCTNSAPASVPRSTAADSFRRFTDRKYAASPSSTGGFHPREKSPPCGSSTLTTRAPRSARTIVASGPARTRVRSRTTIPSSGGRRSSVMPEARGAKAKLKSANRRGSASSRPSSRACGRSSASP